MTSITRRRRTLGLLVAAAVLAAPAAAQDSTKAEFKPTWNFEAWLFGTFTYQVDSAARAANNGAAYSKFTVDRAYLTFLGRVAPDFGFRVTTDVKMLPANNVYSGLIIRLKYAYMEWDFLHAKTATDWSAWARIGQIHTVIIEEEEHFWPRWIQKTALEYWALQPGAADLGASAQFILPGKWGAAYLTIANGGGYQVAADQDRYKDVATRFSLTPLGKAAGYWKRLEVTPWIQVGRTQSTGATPVGLENNAGGIFLGDSDPRLSFGVEYAERQFQTMPATTVVTTTAKVYDGFVSVRPSLFFDPHGVPWGILLRGDHFLENEGGAAYRTLALGGVFLDVAKNSSFAITYQIDAGHDGSTPPDLAIWQLNWQLTF